MTDARSLTLFLSGRWLGQYGTAPCPVCQPARRRGQCALTLADGQAGLLLNCKKSGCGFLDILAAAGLRAGDYTPPDPATLAKREAERRAEAKRRAAQAARLWQEARPVAGTVAETYMRGRAITAPLPASLRFHPSCFHGASGRCFPAMLGLIEGGDGFALHRTWLRPDGSGKAPVAPPKAMLGAAAGGAVRLTNGPGRLVVGEGIESTFSAFILRGDTTAQVWAALSTSGMRGLRLPAEPGALCIAPDGDAPGREAAHALAHRAHALGWAVSLFEPGDGLDFNDVLQERAAA